MRPSLRNWMIIITAVISCSLFFFIGTGGEMGFPLDDAWIHQTYARNLAENGRWEYRAGEASAGSTSPLWTLLLTGGYFLKGLLLPEIWSFLLGLAALVGTALLGERFARKNNEGYNRQSLPWVGWFLILEWHILWAAGSGMETVWIAFACLLVIYLAGLEQPMTSLWTGLAVGGAVWLRPEGITLVGPVLLILVLRKDPMKTRLLRIGLIVVGLILPLAGYFWLNHQLAGTILPSTFFAKQSEYQSLLAIPLPSRVGSLLMTILAGGGFLLVPGCLFELRPFYWRRNPSLLAAGLWITGFVLIYALRLPVTYQHARYLIPVLPVYIVLGISGFERLFTLAQRKSRLWKIVTRAWLGATILTTLAFWVLGVQALRDDIRFIRETVVETVFWVEDNLPDNTVIATHDIGALGYLTDRPFIDIAGLVNPEVIAIIDEMDGLGAYLDARNVDVLMTFPQGYETLVAGKEILYETGQTIGGAYQGLNMVVYRWR